MFARVLTFCFCALCVQCRTVGGVTPRSHYAGTFETLRSSVTGGPAGHRCHWLDKVAKPILFDAIIIIKIISANSRWSTQLFSWEINLTKHEMGLSVGAQHSDICVKQVNKEV